MKTTTSIVLLLVAYAVAFGGQRRIDGERVVKSVPSVPPFAFASADIEFAGPVSSVQVDIVGGGWVTCWTPTGIEFGSDVRVASERGTIGLSTVPFANIGSCTFDSDTGGTFTNVRTE